MPWEDTRKLIAQECQKKGVYLDEDQMQQLFNRTGGVPLALVWSIAQIGRGYAVEAVLTRLGQPNNDIARFCFEGAVGSLRGKPAYQLLLALSMFSAGASRGALGYVADLPILDRDDGLVLLEGLSLIDKRKDRFTFLPLTRSYVLAELDQDPIVKMNLGQRWVAYFRELCQGVESEYYWRYKSYAFYEDGDNILDAINWSMSHGTAEDVFVLTYAAYDFLEVAGRWNEIITICTQVLELARSIQKKSSTAKQAVARITNTLGWIYMQRGEFEEAETLFHEALGMYRLISNRVGEAIGLQHLSSVFRKKKLFEQSKKSCDQAWEMAVALNDGDLEALINTAYGKLARDQGDWVSAWDYFSRVRDWFEKRVEQIPRDEPLARSTWGHLEIIAYHLGRPLEAKELCLRSLDFFEERGTKGYLATLKYRLALAEEALGEFQNALAHAVEAVDWFDRLGMKPDYIEARKLLDRIQTEIRDSPDKRISGTNI